MCIYLTAALRPQVQTETQSDVDTPLDLPPESYSVWWVNCHVVQQHIKNMLSPSDGGRLMYQLKDIKTVRSVTQLEL